MLRPIKETLAVFTAWLVAFGPAGLFLIALLDSAFVPLPGGADAVMLLLSRDATPASMILCAVAGTLGSVIGCLILYHISRRAGASALRRFSIERQARVKNLVDRYDVLAVLVASVLPPPFPFKLFVVSAGVFRMNQFRFAAGVAAGRMFRFLLEGWLAIKLGREAEAWIKSNYPAIGIGVVVLLVGVFVAKNLVGRRQRRSAES